MHCNFTFYVFVSSSLFFLEVVMKIFDYFWKSNSLFSKFCVNCLLMFYFVYCNNCALKDVMEPINAPACCWPCACLKCVSGRRRVEKKLFEMHTCHRPGAQLWFRHKWRKLVTASLLLHCIDGYSCLRYLNGSFSAAFQVLHWSFLVLHFDENVCNWIPKVIWPRMA